MKYFRICIVAKTIVYSSVVQPSFFLYSHSHHLLSKFSVVKIVRDNLIKHEYR